MIWTNSRLLDSSFFSVWVLLSGNWRKNQLCFLLIFEKVKNHSKQTFLYFLTKLSLIYRHVQKNAADNTKQRTSWQKPAQSQTHRDGGDHCYWQDRPTDKWTLNALICMTDEQHYQTYSNIQCKWEFEPDSVN